MAECQDELDWCRLAWSEMCGHPLDLNKPGESVSRVPGALVTDATDLYDAVNARESAGLGVRDKRAAIEALRIRENLTENNTEMRWVNSAAMLGDGITKVKAAWMLVRFFKNRQLYRLVHDPARHSARFRAANAIGKFEDIPDSTRRDDVRKPQEIPNVRNEPSGKPGPTSTSPGRATSLPNVAN